MPTTIRTLTPIGFTYISPLGLYSEKVTDYKDIPEGAKITIPERRNERRPRTIAVASNRLDQIG